MHPGIKVRRRPRRLKDEWLEGLSPPVCCPYIKLTVDRTKVLVTVDEEKLRLYKAQTGGGAELDGSA